MEVTHVFLCFAGKPHSIESSERIQLSGTYNVRKGKLQLPVNRWSRRQVILCGTCLMVSSVKASNTGKMHILPLIGGKVMNTYAIVLRERLCQTNDPTAPILKCTVAKTEQIHFSYSQTVFSITYRFLLLVKISLNLD